MHLADLLDHARRRLPTEPDEQDRRAATVLLGLATLLRRTEAHPASPVGELIADLHRAP